jgi:hypothetical protein
MRKQLVHGEFLNHAAMGTSTDSATTLRSPPGLASRKHNAQQMSGYDEEVAHSGDGIKASKPPDCANFL